MPKGVLDEVSYLEGSRWISQGRGTAQPQYKAQLSAGLRGHACRY